MNNGEVTIRTLAGVHELDAAIWDDLANPKTVDTASADYEYNPFLSHAFFQALELSGSASPETGWLAQHLLLEDSQGQALGLLPCYLKNHSQGEYVFDHGWADAFERAGGDYYPKLQAAVPFTPVTGRRFLVGKYKDADRLRALLAAGLQEVCKRHTASSAHITFLTKDEWNALEKLGYLRRVDQQFHWINKGYSSFSDFLSELSSSKRKTIRKERRRALDDTGITVEWLTGSQLSEEIWDEFYTFYLDTGSRKWGSPYLTRDFYTRINKTMAQDVLLIMAKREGRYIAGAINFIGSHTLFGRHWGCLEDHPFLHFEICYYQAIDFAISKGLKRVEAGAQGGHKLARGYMPQLTYSAHHITHPDFRQAVEDYLNHERPAVEREATLISEHSPFRKQTMAD